MTDSETLDELQSRNLPFATCENIELVITGGDGNEESKKAASDIIAEADVYFARFTPGPNCPQCNATLTGWLGSFIWGLANGEGHCSQCKYPARAYHRGGPFEIFHCILPYHPNVLAMAKAD